MAILLNLVKENDFTERLWMFQNKDMEGVRGTLPPLLVRIHGGPTAQFNNVLSLGIQYFTSRGIAVLCVNNRGSTGYGRKYRHLLNGK